MGKDKDEDSGTASPVDLHVGLRVRHRRVELGLSQTNLANLLGISFRQVQKYEKGVNRLGASRLYDTARVLGTTIDYFFEEMAPDIVAYAAYPPPPQPQMDTDNDGEIRREVVDLIRAYQRIPDQKIRRRVQELARALGDKPQPK